MSSTRKATAKTDARETGGPFYIVKALIALIDELAQLMTREVALLETRKMAEHAELLKRKQRLTIDYRAGMKSIVAQPELLKDLPDEIRVALKTSAQKLATVTDQNAKMLRTAVMATQRLIQNIVSIVKKESLTKPGYTDPRTAHMALGVYSPVCKSVAVSQTA